MNILWRFKMNLVLLVAMFVVACERPKELTIRQEPKVKALQPSASVSASTALKPLGCPKGPMQPCSYFDVLCDESHLSFRAFPGAIIHVFRGAEVESFEIGDDDVDCLLHISALVGLPVKVTSEWRGLTQTILADDKVFVDKIEVTPIP